MRSYLLLFLSLSLLLILPRTATAQIDGRFDASMVLGFSVSQVDGDDYAGFKKWGLTGGPRVDINLTEDLSLSVELLYNNIGSNQPARTKSVPPEPGFTLDFHYMNVPIMINYNDQDRMIFGLGLGYNRLITLRHFEDDLQITDPDPIENFEIKNWDLELQGQATIKLGEHFGAGFKYGYSLVPIGKIRTSNFRNFGVFHNSISVKAMYFF